MAEKTLSMLATNPALAQRIGFLMGDYALIEYLFFINYFAAATRNVPNVGQTHMEESFREFYSQRSINPKVELFDGVTNGLPQDILGACKRITRRLKGTASRRTDVAHCVFLSKGTAITRLSAAKPTPSFEPLDEDYLDRTTTQFHRVAEDLLGLAALLVGNRDRAAHLLRVLPVPPGAQPAEMPSRLAPLEPHEKARGDAIWSRLFPPSKDGP
jgi:hypothetical protein